MLKITLVRSVIGNTPGNRKTVQALGLRRTGRTVYRQDTPSVRGMIRNVAHLLKVEHVDSAPEKVTKVKKTVSVISRPEPKAEKPKVAAKPKSEAKPAEKAPAEPKPAAKKPAAKKPAAEKPAAKKAAPKGRKPDTERKSFGEVGKAKKK